MARVHVTNGHARLIVIDEHGDEVSYPMEIVSKIKGYQIMSTGGGSHKELSKKEAHGVDCILFPETYHRQFDEVIDETEQVVRKYKGK